MRSYLLLSAASAMALTAGAAFAQSAPAVQEPTELDEVVVTNTIPLSAAATQCPKIRQLSVAPLIAQTIQRIARGESVMRLFQEQENLF